MDERGTMPEARANRSRRRAMALGGAMAALACAALAPSARALDLTAWRGETVNALVPANERVGEARDGFELKVGALKGVDYSQAPKIWRKATTNALDRVAWGETSGPRVVQVKVPRDAKAGMHEFGGLRVKVLDRTITPVRGRSYRLDLWQHPWAVARCSGTKPFSKEHYDAMRPLWTELASLGQKVVTATIVRYPWSRQCRDGYETMVRHVKAADGSWTFDYTTFDEYVEFAHSCGLGPEIACYSICPWDGGRVWWDEPGKRDMTARAKPGTKEYEEYWAPFLADFARHLKERGWLELATVALDERSPEEAKAAADLVRRSAPALRVELCGNRPYAAFAEIAPDVYSQGLEHVSREFLAEAARRRARGLKTSFYVCNSPLSPNTFVFSSPAEAYWLGLYPAVAGLDGFLRWAYNSWPGRPMESADYAGLFAGDTFLVYPDGSPSIRLLMLQNGIEAAEKYALLRKWGGHDAELDALAALFDAKDALWKKAGYFERIRDAAECALNGQAAGRDGFAKPDISYEDGCETFAGPARGYAPGGWTVFKPEGLPKWRGAKAYNSSLWELSRFSGGREQGGKRPGAERVGAGDAPLTDAMKADVRRFLDETRANGGSLVVRLGYTWSDSPGCEPSDFGVVLGHVRDLSKIIAEYDDVVVGVEAGVAGPWGEMHTSDYCKAEYMNRVLETYCDNLPEGISILVRAPGFICKMAGKDTAGTLKMLPFADSRLRRLGMFNDGYLGTWWDYGTWAGDFRRERGVGMLRTFADHPYGGELAYVGLDWIEGNRERTRELFEPERWNIVKEWYDTHLNYLRNVGDRKHALCRFISGLTFDSGRFRFDGMPGLGEYDGLDLHKFMLDHMGYRFVVRDARVPKALRRGGGGLVALEVENTGFGKLLLPSRAEVVLSAGGKARAIPAEGGFSSIPGGEKRRVGISFRVPEDLPPGDCGLYVRVSAPLKDEKAGETPRRPVRFANAGMWNEELKANCLGHVAVK